jgi:hypothetical protein
LELVEKMDQEVEAIKEEIYRCSWFMRGGLPASDLYNVDVKDIDIIQKIIKQNLETTKDSGLPFF